MNYLSDIFAYSEEQPLIFTRLYFWGFFAIVLGIYSILYKRMALRNTYLFLVSLFFYYKTSGLFVSILLFSTLVDYQIGNWIHRSNNKLKRKWLVAASVFINLLLLGFFKYAHFFTDNINQLFGTHFQAVNYFAQMTNAFTGSHFEVGKIL
ncbi:MAG: MBOAT family protein, partial [Flavobacteriales bacterium]